MIYGSNQIITTIGVSGVALVAGIPTTEWAGFHVYKQMSSPEFVGNINVGRLPVVELFELSSDYQFQAEPDHIGTRTSEFVIRILVPTTINRHSTETDLLQKLKVAILKALTNNLNLGVTNVQAETPKIMPYCSYLDIRLSTETSYDKNYQEGT
jgi:hypothetical protein